ncbi:hypothetical protein [Nocardioides sp. CF8]|uniref:hypothetical protein n=1 Tax=Nocardioides sp. CF8 TaxID=110319 RepID=UPI0018DEAED8|nr:hypothetical protein [Nocardioides sp. CF8]
MMRAAEDVALGTQMAVGGLEFLALSLVMWAVAAYVAYWVLRKAIAHGIQDAQRHGENRSDNELRAPDAPLDR